MHRETTISREIKLLKNKFELLEKNRQFRSILQKTSNTSSGSNMMNTTGGDNSDDLASGLDSNDFSRTRSEATSEADSRRQSSSQPQLQQQGQQQSSSKGTKNVRIKLSKLGTLSQIFAPLWRTRRRPTRVRRKSNKVSSISSMSGNNAIISQHQQQQVDTLLAKETGYSLSSDLISQQEKGRPGETTNVAPNDVSDSSPGQMLSPPSAEDPEQQQAPTTLTNNNKKPAKSKLFGRLFR